jgi:hypothetical protein
MLDLFARVVDTGVDLLEALNCCVDAVMMLSSNPRSAVADPPFADFGRIALGTTVGLKL